MDHHELPSSPYTLPQESHQNFYHPAVMREITPENGFPYFTGQETYDTTLSIKNAIFEMTLEKDFRENGCDYHTIRAFEAQHGCGMLWAALLLTPNSDPTACCISLFCSSDLDINKRLDFLDLNNKSSAQFCVSLTPEQYACKNNLTAWRCAILLYRINKMVFINQCRQRYNVY